MLQIVASLLQYDDHNMFKVQGVYSQYFIFFVTYELVQ